MMSSRATGTAMATPNPTLHPKSSDEGSQHNVSGMVISTTQLMLKIDMKLSPLGLSSGVIVGAMAGLLFLMGVVLLGIILLRLFKRKRGKVKIEKSIILHLFLVFDYFLQRAYNHIKLNPMNVTLLTPCNQRGRSPETVFGSND